MLSRIVHRLPSVKHSLYRRVKPVRSIKLSARSVRVPTRVPTRVQPKRKYSTARHFQLEYSYKYQTNFFGLSFDVPIVFQMYGNDNLSNHIQAIIPSTLQEFEKNVNILTMVYDRNKVIETIVKILNEDLEYNDLKSRCENVKLG